MKKILFATTALVGSAGAAAADVEITGFAEMGMFGGEYGDADIEPQFHNDFTIIINGSGETDNGLVFGMLLELEDSADAAGINTDNQSLADPLNDLDGGAFGGIGSGGGDDEINGRVSIDNEAVFVSGGFGTITLGETDGAFDFAMNELGFGGGTLRDDHTIHPGFNGNSGFDSTFDNQIARYEYSFDNFAVAASAELGDNDELENGNAYSLGATYDTEFSGVALGFGLGLSTIDELDDELLDEDEEGGGRDIYGLSMDATFDNGLLLGLNYSDSDELFEHYGAAIGYSSGPFSIGLNYGNYDFEGGGEADGFAIAANYDLGGGAVVQFGYADGDPAGTDADGDDIDDYRSYSLGLALSF